MRRPWNIIDSPVYSLATSFNGSVNMNICTYVVSVSMKPKQYMVSLDYNTKTYQNMVNSDYAVLQLLSKENMPLVRLLGKKSGNNVDKQANLERKNLLDEWQGMGILKNTSAHLYLKKIGSQNTHGDHEHFFFSVEKFKTIDDQNILMFQDLIDNKIIL